MRIDELVKIFNLNYPKNQISREDVLKAVNSVSRLGTGCRIVNDQFISTVPFELSNDQMLLIGFAEKVRLAQAARLRQRARRERPGLVRRALQPGDQQARRRRPRLGRQAGPPRRRLLAILLPRKLIIAVSPQLIIAAWLSPARRPSKETSEKSTPASASPRSSTTRTCSPRPRSPKPHQAAWTWSASGSASRAPT